MMPKEVREFVKKLVKEGVNEELHELKDGLAKVDDKVNDLQKDINILKEGDNI